MSPIDNAYATEVGERLALVREWKGMSMSQFARRAGIGDRYYTVFEPGKKRISKRIISLQCARKLKAAYGVPLDWIYDGDIHDMMPTGLLNCIKARA